MNNIQLLWRNIIAVNLLYIFGNCQIIYNGPALNEYFASTFNQQISDLPELVCDEYYFGETNDTNPVVYYKLDLTADMLKTWKSKIVLTTYCDEPGQFNIRTDNIRECPDNINVTHQCYKNNNLYRNHCSKDNSLDTFIYILYQKRGQLNLIETVDDMWQDDMDIWYNATDEQKSAINLVAYKQRQYIIGIGGYAQEYGKYLTELKCEPYSWPITADNNIHEIDPSDNNAKYISSNDYDQTITDSFINKIQNKMEYIRYFQFDITQNTYFPMIIRTCLSIPKQNNLIPANVFIFTKDEFDESKYKIVTSASRTQAFTEITLNTNMKCPGGVISKYDTEGKYINWFGTEFILDDSKINLYQFETEQTYYIGFHTSNDLLQYKNEVNSNGYGNGEIRLKISTAAAPTQSPTKSPTVNPTPSPTYQYSFPIKEELEFSTSINAQKPSFFKEIKPGKTIFDEKNTKDKEISYYRFSINDNVLPCYSPSYITTCNNIQNGSYIYPTYIYIIKQLYDGSAGDIILNSESTLSNEKQCEISIDTLTNGEYYVAVQGINHQIGNFSISMTCTEPQAKLPRELVKGLVFGIMGCLIFLFICYYIYEWNKWHKNKYKTVETNDKNDKHTNDMISQIRNTDNNINDMVQATLQSAIDNCDNKEGFDVYQTLAIRWYDKNSTNVTPVTPFANIGIRKEFIVISPFSQALLKAIIIGTTQAFGMSVVCYKLMYAYFFIDEFEDVFCIMDAKRWSQVISLKLLAFLLSLTITFSIGLFLNKLKHNGLYEISTNLLLKHMKNIPNVSLWVLQIGQGINYYVCLLAVIGSYFIVFQSNKGEKNDNGTLDYSTAGLDMILNCVALFFMLELDNALVTDKDYFDCKLHLKETVFKKYKADPSINCYYMKINEPVNDPINDSIINDCNSIMVQQIGTNKANEEEEGINYKYPNKFTAKFVVPFMYYTLKVFENMVSIVCYGGGFVAPFIIFFCW